MDVIGNILKRINYKTLIKIIFILGVFFRCILLFKNNSLFLDEILLMQNIRDCTYTELFHGLSLRQVSPPLFLVLSKFLINIFSSSNAYVNDFVPKVIPFISGITAIPIFYKFTKKLIKDDFARICAFCLFCLNPFTICYSAIFKQYSTELLFSVLLLNVFYGLIFEQKFKKTYIFAVILAPWFSLSSVFIIIPLSLLYFCKNKSEFLKRLLLPLIFTFSLFFFIYLHPTLSSSYYDMDKGYEHLYFNLFRMSTKLCFTFVMSKILLICSIIFLFSKRDWEEKYYIISPIIFTLIVSSLHYYFMYIRLHLFLFPLYIFLLTAYSWKFKKTVISVMCLLFFASSIYYTINPIKWTYISTATSGRQISQFVYDNIKPDDILVYGNDDAEFNYYFPKDRFPQKTIKLPYWYRTQTALMKSELAKLPHGSYWYIFMYPVKDKNIIDETVGIVEKEIYLNSNAIKFNK